MRDEDGNTHALPAPAAGLSRSLSSRLLVITLVSIMVVEVMVYLPSIANFRRMFLEQHLASAQVAVLAAHGSGATSAPDRETARSILATIDVLSARLNLPGRREMALALEEIGRIDARYDLTKAGALALIADAFATLARGGRGVIEVRAHAINLEDGSLAIVMRERQLFDAMVTYSRNIFLLSLVISLTAAALVFASLYVLMVRPMQQLTRAMVRFREAPEDPAATLVPSARGDEIGVAEREFAHLQHELRRALKQRRHLAELGEAVSKISHDLRNILATAQLSSERLMMVEDPTVRELSSRLLRAVDRALDLAERTLRHGRAEEAPPQPAAVDLRALVDEVAVSLGLRGEAPAGAAPEIVFRNRVPPGCRVLADPDHLFRILLNLGRNAVQAMRTSGGTLTVSARTDGHRMVVVEVADTGPGLPEKARAHLFVPFKGSTHGIGLGLAIVAELVRANGGTVWLERSGPDGTVFGFRLPMAQDAPCEPGAAVKAAEE
ncbi:MAG: ATPase [Rhodothalassiaceae bacterium]|nr:MAG: ATPase [Rhodothalassiaceae bacterium]